MPIDFHDIEATEPDYYKILQQILDSPIDLFMMDLTFSAEIQKFGRTEVRTASQCVDVCFDYDDDDDV